MATVNGAPPWALIISSDQPPVGERALVAAGLQVTTLSLAELIMATVTSITRRSS